MRSPLVYVNGTCPSKALHTACLQGKTQFTLLQTLNHSFQSSSQMSARVSTILHPLRDSALLLPHIAILSWTISLFPELLQNDEMTQRENILISFLVYLRVHLNSFMGCCANPYEYIIQSTAWCDPPTFVAAIVTSRHTGRENMHISTHDS